MRISVGYPDVESEREIRYRAVRAPSLDAVLSADEVCAAQDAVESVRVIRRSSATFSTSSPPRGSRGSRARRQPTCRQGFIGPRSRQRSSRTALRAARSHQGLAVPVLAHRLQLRRKPTSIGRERVAAILEACGCRWKATSVSAANTRREATPARQRRRDLDRVDLSAPEPSAHPRGMALPRGDDRDHRRR
jgi:hypothetical protein